MKDRALIDFLRKSPDTLKQVEESLADIQSIAPEFSEDALALLYSSQNLETLRFTAEYAKYYHWTATPLGGGVWQRDTILRTFDGIRKLIRDQSMTIDQGLAGKRSRLCSASTISAVERLVRTDQRTAMTVDQWDANDFLLNTPVGLIDLATGKSLGTNRLEYCTKMTACPPSSVRPKLWHACLDRWTAGNEDMQGFLRRMCGYGLTGITSEHQFFFISGSGRNGKGVFLNTFRAITDTYAKIAPPEVFTIPKAGEKHPTALAGLVGCRIALATETEPNARWAETQLKALVAADPIATRFMRQDFFEFVPRFKLMISGNHRPTLSNVDEAIRARLNILPFEVFIPPEERDKDLLSKLRAEWGGILQWMIDGCLEWQRDGLNPPECVRLATDNYFEGQDVMGQWLAESCVLGPNCRSKSQALYASWIKWCEENNQYKTSSRAFLGALGERRNIKTSGPGTHTNAGNYVLGVGLLEDGGYAL